jgi:hypothetical protein
MTLTVRQALSEREGPDAFSAHPQNAKTQCLSTRHPSATAVTSAALGQPRQKYPGKFNSTFTNGSFQVLVPLRFVKGMSQAADGRGEGQRERSTK